MVANCCEGHRKRLQQPRPLEDRADLHPRPDNVGIGLQNNEEN